MYKNFNSLVVLQVTFPENFNLVPSFSGYLHPIYPSSQTLLQNFKLSRKLLYYHAKLGYYHGNSRLLRDSIILPQSPSYQQRTKHKKVESTNHSDEPHQTSKSLDFKPFFNTFACEYQKSYGIISE